MTALLATVLLAVHHRVRWLERCGGAYPVWALLSGIAVGTGYGAGPFWLWPVVLAVSGIAGCANHSKMPAQRTRC